MEESLLLTGYHTPLGKILSRHLMDDGARIAAAVSPEQLHASPGEEAEEGLSFLEWSRSSPISAHNVLLETLQIHDTIDRALFIFDTARDNRALHELSLAEIERYIDTRFKGIIFLLKELIHHYQRSGRAGEISLIIHSEGAKVLPPLDGMGTGAFRSMGNSLFTFYQNEALTINGFDSSSPESEEYASFIVKTLKEKAGKRHGKWFRFQDKGVWNALGFSGKR